MKKTGYTYEQHDKLGLELQTMLDRLCAIHSELTKVYPTKLADEIEPARIAIIALRNILDAKVSYENPNNPEANRVYYRRGRPDYEQSR